MIWWHHILLNLIVGYISTELAIRIGKKVYHDSRYICTRIFFYPGDDEDDFWFYRIVFPLFLGILCIIFLVQAIIKYEESGEEISFDKLPFLMVIGLGLYLFYRVYEINKELLIW